MLEVGMYLTLTPSSYYAKPQYRSPEGIYTPTGMPVFKVKHCDNTWSPIAHSGRWKLCIDYIELERNRDRLGSCAVQDVNGEDHLNGFEIYNPVLLNMETVRNSVAGL